MNPVKQKEDTVLYAAINMDDTTQRRAFLVQVCAENNALRRTVEKKLAARDDAEMFFASPTGILHHFSFEKHRLASLHWFQLI